MSEKKKSIIKNVFMYVPSRYFSQGLGFFTAILMRRFLGPLYTGIWQMLKLIKEYMDRAELGSTFAVYYKVPFFKGKQDVKELEKTRDIVFSFILLTSMVAGMALVIYALVFQRHLEKMVYLGLFVLSVFIVLDRIYTFYILFMRANKDYKVLSKSIVFDAVINLTLILLIVSRFRLYGLYAVVIIVPILNIMYIRHHSKDKINMAFDRHRLFSYIKFGFPLYIVNFLQGILQNIDRIMIVSFLGLKSLGFYSIAMMAKSYSSQIATNFSHVTSPFFLEEYGKCEDPQKVSGYVTNGTFAVSCVMAVLLGLIFICAPPLVVYVLPKFIPGITAMKIFIAVTFFASINSFSNNFLVILEKQIKLIPIIVTALSINLILNFIFIKQGFGISGVASATAISIFAYFIIVFTYAMSHISDNALEIMKALFRVLLPFAYCAVALLYLEISFRDFPIIFGAACKLGFFIIMSLLIIFYLNKETSLVGIAIKLIGEKFKKDTDE